MSRAHYILSQSALYAIIGSACGLVVWILMIWSSYDLWHPERLVPERFPLFKLYTILLLYLPVGTLMGVGLSLVEPVQDSSFRAAIRNERRWILRGALLGALGALVGGVVGEYLLESILQSAAPGADERSLRLWGRVIGVLTFGLILGSGLGLLEKWRTASNERLLAGVVGGALGGVAAAVFFQMLQGLPEVMTVISLMIFAAATAGAIGSITFLKTRAVLVGMQENIFKYNPQFRRRLNADSENRIGSAIRGRQSGKTNFKIVQDRDVMKEHASIMLDPHSRDWTIARSDVAATELYVNRKQVGGERVKLRNGDVLTLGKTSFRFQLER